MDHLQQRMSTPTTLSLEGHRAWAESIDEAAAGGPVHAGSRTLYTDPPGACRRPGADEPRTTNVGVRVELSGKVALVTGSSRGAFRGEPESPAYGASKAGLNAMSQSMAQALAPHGVFFYAVAPGFVETDMANPLLRGPMGDAIRSQSPLGRVAAPEEVARTVAFLASEAPDFMTGAIVDVNGASYLRS
jgi:hypothetical protein